jgi:hypothetical protein
MCTAFGTLLILIIDCASLLVHILGSMFFFDNYQEFIMRVCIARIGSFTIHGNQCQL